MGIFHSSETGMEQENKGKEILSSCSPHIIRFIHIVSLKRYSVVHNIAANEMKASY